MIGKRAKFFHPLTFGAMFLGTVTKVHKNGKVTVKFEADGKSYVTSPEHNE